MRYTPQHKSITHKKIVNTASELFRDQSIGSVGVSDLMNRAGLTHGGFYAHFSSKEALAAEAIKATFDEAWQRRKRFIGETAPGRKFITAVERYMTTMHRDNSAKGCPAAALASEVAHHPGPIRDAMTAGVKRWISGVEQMVAEDGLAIDAHAAIATMVGAMVLSRGMADPAVADQFIKAARETLLSLAQRSPAQRSLPQSPKSPSRKRAKRAKG
jgi:TetR/AcrR family transcriptional repressor of nem operon